MIARGATIRLARLSDAAGMATLSRDLIEHGLAWRYSGARIARLIREPEVVAVVAVGEPAPPAATADAADAAEDLHGFAIMQFADEHAHLVLLCTRADRQRRGIGRSLLAWLDRSAEVAGIASVHLELRADNPGGEAFYLQLGYTPTLDVPAYYDGRIAARRMVRVLRRSAVPE